MFQQKKFSDVSLDGGSVQTRQKLIMVNHVSPFYFPCFNNLIDMILIPCDTCHVRICWHIHQIKYLLETVVLKEVLRARFVTNVSVM